LSYRLKESRKKAQRCPGVTLNKFAGLI